MKTNHSERFSSLEILESRVAPAAGIIAAAGGGLVSLFADTDANDTYETKADTFSPFFGYKGAISVALGDLDGDQNDELITAKGKGTNAVIRIWDLSGSGRVGALLDELVPFAGTKHRGVSVAIGDLDSDGVGELLVGAGPGAVNSIKIYADANLDGRLSDNTPDIFAPFAATFKGGVKVAAGDTNNTGGTEVVVASWSGGGTVSVFNDANANRLISDDGGLPLESFQPFGSKYRAGINVASGQIDGAGMNGAEVIVGTARGTPKVLIFADAIGNGIVSDDPIFDTLLPRGPGLGSGAAVAAGDTDDSGTFVEVLVGPGSGGGSHVKIFDDDGDMQFLLSDSALDHEFDAFARMSGGLNLAFGKVRTAVVSSPGFSQSINDSSTLTSSIFVPSNVGIIRDLDVSLSIFHTFDGDLDVTLTHVASGISLVLFQDVGGSNEGFLIRLSDESGADISTATNPKADGAISGNFNPTGGNSLSVFDGISGGGEWRLTITDDSGGDTGTLLGWSLYFGL